MIGLLHSWRNSLRLLTPHNFKSFALATFTSMIETYKVLARVWYLWLIPMIVLVALTSLMAPGVSFHKYILLNVSLYMITTITCLAARPSIKQKNLHYFTHYMRFFLILFFVATILVSCDYYFLAGWLRYLGFMTGIVSPLWVFFILFFLDSDGSIKQLGYALFCAIKMIVYNLPLLLVLMILMLLLVFPLVFPIFVASKWWSEYIWDILVSLLAIFLVNPLFINIWTNIYVKKLHEMPGL